MRVARTFSFVSMVAIICICVFSTSAFAYEELDSATLGEKNAAQMAKNYLEFTPFSRVGLIEQLEYEGFTHDEAVYGVNQCEADWFEQAARMAKNYLELSSFSRTKLIEQLEYEGFTHEQAEYGAESVGY